MKKKYYILIIGIAVAIGVSAFAFMDTTYSIHYTAGDHGKVNDRTGVFTETDMHSREGYPILITPDEGYMVDQIIIDGEVDAESTKEAHKSLIYVIEDFSARHDTNIEVSFKEIDDPALLASADKGFNITATCEGPGDIMTVFDNNKGKYLSTDDTEDRTIDWFADADQNGVVKSVMINGVEDPSFAGKEDGSYVAISGDVSVHVIFEKSKTPAVDPEDIEYSVVTSAKAGGTITDSYTYTVDEDNSEQEIVYAADPGYYIESVTINGEKKSVSDDAGIGEEQGSYQFTKGNQNIAVTFTTLSSVTTKAGTISMNPDKPELNRHDTVNFEIAFEPKDTSKESTYKIDISDFKFVSSDKGEFQGTALLGTIDAGVTKEVINLCVEYADGTLDGIITAKLYNNRKAAKLESDIFLISEEDLSLPEEDEIILDKSDIIDEDVEKAIEKGTDSEGDIMDKIIVAIIMILMIVGGLFGCVYATKKGNSGFTSSVKYKEKRDDDRED